MNVLTSYMNFTGRDRGAVFPRAPISREWRHRCVDAVPCGGRRSSFALVVLVAIVPVLVVLVFVAGESPTGNIRDVLTVGHHARV